MIDVIAAGTEPQLLKVPVVQPTPFLVKSLRMPDFIDTLLPDISQQVLTLGVKTAQGNLAIRQNGDVVIQALTKVDLVLGTALIF
jgi:hypothetical protein